MLLAHFSFGDCESICVSPNYQIGNMNHWSLFWVRSWNNNIRCLFSYVLANWWLGWIISWDIACPVGFTESGPLSLTCSVATLLRTRLTTDTQQICFHLYTFHLLCAWEGWYPHILLPYSDSYWIVWVLFPLILRRLWCVPMALRSY